MNKHIPLFLIIILFACNKKDVEPSSFNMAGKWVNDAMPPQSGDTLWITADSITWDWFDRRTDYATTGYQYISRNSIFVSPWGVSAYGSDTIYVEQISENEMYFYRQPYSEYLEAPDFNFLLISPPYFKKVE